LFQEFFSSLIFIEKNAVLQRLFVAGIKPLTKEAIYPEAALEAIRSVPAARGDLKRSRKMLDRASFALYILIDGQCS
jgi:hypothetical protein